MKNSNCKLTMSVTEAGKKYFDMGRNASYDAAARGDLPTVKIGRRLRVPVRALERMLDHADAPKAANSTLMDFNATG